MSNTPPQTPNRDLEQIFFEIRRARRLRRTTRFGDGFLTPNEPIREENVIWIHDELDDIRNRRRNERLEDPNDPIEEPEETTETSTTTNENPVEEPPSTPGHSPVDSDNEEESLEREIEQRVHAAEIVLDHQINYNFLERLLRQQTTKINESTKSIIEDLVNDLMTYHFSSVYSEILTFTFDTNDFLQMSNEELRRHMILQEQLNEFKNRKFKIFCQMHLDLLKEYLQYEERYYVKFRNSRNLRLFHLTLGTIYQTNRVVQRIRNFLRNARHLNYGPETYSNKLMELFDMINEMQDDNQIHFEKHAYEHDDFIDYSQYYRYRCLF